MTTTLNAATSAGGGLIQSADSSGILALQTAGTTAITIDATQQAGLGVVPSAWGGSFKGLDISTMGGVGGSPTASFVGCNLYNNGTNWIYKATGAAALFYQNGGENIWYNATSGSAGGTISLTQAMTLDASGRLGIGQTSPSYVLDTYDTTGQARVSRNKTTTGDMGGLLLGGLNASSSAISYALIQSNASTVTAGSEAGNLDFYTMRSGSITQAARIDTSGNLLVGKTTAADGTVGAVVQPTGRLAGALAQSTSGFDTLTVYSTTAAAYRFYVTMDGKVNCTSTTIAGISDVRFKENIRDLDAGLSSIMALKPRKFDWKEGVGKNIKNDRGFIAQEFETVFPDLIGEWKDKPPEGEEPYKTVSADLIPVLVKAIQEQQAIITTLTERITALEAK